MVMVFYLIFQFFRQNIFIVGEMNLSKSGKFEVTLFFSLWHVC